MFVKDQIVEAQKEEHGPESQWFVGKVEGVMEQWPKGEAMYCWSYDLPLPQVIVRLSDGSSQRYSGESVNKFIRQTDKTLQSPRTLKEELERIKITYTFEEVETCRLIDTISSWVKVLEPLFDQKVYPTNCDEITLDEFDSEIILIRADKEGRAMRNSGIPAFEMEIMVDGYAPVTLKRLTISEVHITQ